MAPPDEPSPPGPLRRATASTAGRLVSLRPETLVVAAVKRAGSTELGTETISEPLAVLCRALDAEADLHPRGRWAARRRIVDALVTRGRTLGVVAGAPGVDATAVAPPVVVAAPPGATGRLVRDGLASLGARPADDGRRLEVALASMEPELDFFIPSWSEWIDGADLTQGYRWLRRLLAVADREGGPTQAPWLLDAPQHVERLVDLRSVVPPRAVVVLTGDLDRLADEGAAEIVGRRARWSWRSDVEGVRRYWRWRLARMLERHREQRAALTDTEVIEVDAVDLDADARGTLARVGDRLRSGR